MELKDIMVKPFTSPADALRWQSTNCHLCPLYESESLTAETAVCTAAFFIDILSITGLMPLKECQTIGGRYKAERETVKFNDECRKRLQQAPHEARPQN